MTFALVLESRKTPTAGPGQNFVTSDAVDTTGATLIVVAVASYGTSNPRTMSDSKGNTWTGLASYVASAGTTRHTLYYCISPIVGSGHTFTFSCTGSYPLIRVMAFSGISPVFGSANGTNGGTALTSLSTGSVTPTESTSLVIAGLALQDETATAPTSNSGFTDFTWVPKQTGGSYPIVGSLTSYKIKVTNTAENPTFTWASGSKAATAGIVVFTEGAAPDTTAPTVSTATIDATGTQLTIVFDEVVTGTATGFGIDIGSALTATYVSGDGTNILVFNLSGTVLDADTPVLTYDAGVGDIEDLAGNSLATIVSGAVTNNSTQTADVTAPTLTSVTVTGVTSISLAFDEAVTLTDETGLSVEASGGAITISGVDGDGTNTLVLSMNRSIASTESLSLSYDSGTGDIEDLAGNALATISDRLATNNISATPGSVSLIGPGLIQ